MNMSTLTILNILIINSLEIFRKQNVQVSSFSHRGKTKKTKNPCKIMYIIDYRLFNTISTRQMPNDQGKPFCEWKKEFSFASK